MSPVSLCVCVHSSVAVGHSQKDNENVECVFSYCALFFNCIQAHHLRLVLVRLLSVVTRPGSLHCWRGGSPWTAGVGRCVHTSVAVVLL